MQFCFLIFILKIQASENDNIIDLSTNNNSIDKQFLNYDNIELNQNKKIKESSPNISLNIQNVHIQKQKNFNTKRDKCKMKFNFIKESNIRVFLIQYDEFTSECRDFIHKLNDASSNYSKVLR